MNITAFFGSLTKNERSTLCYLESCAVDGGGLVESIRMNADDYAAIDKMKIVGLLRFGRIHSSVLGKGPNTAWTHWVELTGEGWAVAALCRQLRGEQRGPYAKSVFEAEAQRA